MANKKNESEKKPVKVADLPTKKDAKAGAPASPGDITITKPTNGGSPGPMH